MQIALIMNGSGNEDANDNDSGNVRDFIPVPTITISRPSRILKVHRPPALEEEKRDEKKRKLKEKKMIKKKK